MRRRWSAPSLAGIVIARKQSDEAIQPALDCFAALAMTAVDQSNGNML
jgi:hypothetical protein